MREALFLVLRGTAEGRRYVRRQRPDPGEVAWTEEFSGASGLHDIYGSALAAQPGKS